MLVYLPFNLLEIKGIGSSVTINSYYKLIGYAGLLIAQTGKEIPYSGLDISLTLLSFCYPRKLIKHLKKDRKLTVAKISPGVYYINKETFHTQIIVAKELPPEENLYLRCLTNELQNTGLAKRLDDDYRKHQGQDIYIRYMNQIAIANKKTKGENELMVCEGVLNLFGTSSEEIIARTKKEADEYYQPKIKQLSSQNTYLKSLLTQHNIPFELNNN